MFTVKWVRPGGEEHIAEAAGDLRHENGSLFFTDSAGGERVWMGPGRAYVMNAAGKTVADYRLGAAEAPEAKPPRMSWREAQRAGLAERPARDERFSDDVKRETVFPRDLEGEAEIDRHVRARRAADEAEDPTT